MLVRDGQWRRGLPLVRVTVDLAAETHLMCKAVVTHLVRHGVPTGGTTGGRLEVRHHGGGLWHGIRISEVTGRGRGRLGRPSGEELRDQNVAIPKLDVVCVCKSTSLALKGRFATTSARWH